MFYSYLNRLISNLSRLRLTASEVGKPALITTAAVTTLILGIRHLGWLEKIEIQAFDYLMQLRPAAKPDPRLLIVTISEADLQKLQKWPLSDRTLQKLLTKLESYQPRVIGLDIYRDYPVEPGHTELVAQLQKSDRIIPVCKIKDAETPEIPPPKYVPIERVGFSDLLLDSGRIIRRGLLFQDISPNSRCNTELSFGFQLAQHYLAKEGIEPTLTKEKYLQIGGVIFKPLETNSGGFQNLDARGYQILLNYPASSNLGRQINLTQILEGTIDPTWVKDKIVLIGSTAPSLKDIFYSPYQTPQGQNQKIPGIFAHGQIVSQILSAVLDKYPLFWFLPEWGEVLLILSCSLTGGLLAYLIRHPVRLVIAEGVTAIALLGTSWVLFISGGWLPIIPSILALVGTSSSVIAYTVSKSYQNHKKVALQAQEQEKTIALLQTLLKEKADVSEVTDLPTEEWVNQPGSDQTLPLDDVYGLESEADEESNRKENKSFFSRLLGGRYQIIRVFGSGGFGLTYLAKDNQRPGTPECVVKQLRPARRDEKFLQVARRLFQTEAEILEQLGKHSQIPHLLAYFEENKEFYLVEEYIAGHSLTDEIIVDKRLPEAQVIQIMKGILKILVFIHDHHVIHRDIKPSNIIRRDSDNKLVLIDFGAVKQIQPQTPENQESLTVAIGTRGYTPPEQFAGQPGFTSDIYAVGMMGIQALTGILPYRLSPDPNTGNAQWRQFATVGEDFANILDKMVCYHFVERYQSATEVLQNLKRLES